MNPKHVENFEGKVTHVQREQHNNLVEDYRQLTRRSQDKWKLLSDQRDIEKIVKWIITELTEGNG